MQNPYYPYKMRIAKIISETADSSLKTFELEFENQNDKDEFFNNFKPGQFCQLSIFGKGEAPFGVASCTHEKNIVRFTINKIGSFTSAIHKMKENDAIGLRGPLGNWYPIENFYDHNIVIIGGGYAFTTLFALTQEILLSTETRSQYKDLTVIYGAREPDLFLYKDETFKWHEKSDINFHQTIDTPAPGWKYLTGFVPNVVKEIAPTAKNSVAFVCGPPIMIKFTLPVLKEIGFNEDNIITSVEKRMKCGIGKCGRCNIGHKYICKDGPVFSFRQLNELPADL